MAKYGDSRRNWTDLAEQRTFSYYPEFEELYRHVDFFWNRTKRPDSWEAIDDVEGLRHHLAPIVRSRYFNDSEIAANLGVPRTTARRFLDGGLTTWKTHITMMRSLAEQYGIEYRKVDRDNSADQQSNSGPDVVAPVEHLEAEEAIEELLDVLEAMVPASHYDVSSNRIPIELTLSQYELLVATLRSARAFSDVQAWDSRAIRIIRSLNEILLELDKLLQTATSVASKRVGAMLKGVSSILRRIADAVYPDSS